MHFNKEGNIIINKWDNKANAFGIHTLAKVA
jgi:hypothetical protein